MNAALFFLGVLLLILALAGVVYLALRLGAVLFRALERPSREAEDGGYSEDDVQGRRPHQGGSRERRPEHQGVPEAPDRDRRTSVGR